MRKAMYILAMGLLMVCATSYAGSIDQVLIPVTSNAGIATSTVSSVRGWIEEISIDVVTAVTTGDVTIAVTPSLSTLTAENIYTADDIDADLTIRPRLDGSDTAGSALTSDDPWRKAVVGDDIVVTLENVNATNRVFNIIIKYEKK